MVRHVVQMDDLNPEIGALGLFSDYPAIRLCYFINRKLGFRLERMAEDLAMRRDGRIYYFFTFSFFREEDGLQYFLAANRGHSRDKGPVTGLFTEVPAQLRIIPGRVHFDYLMWYESDDALSGPLEALQKELAQLPPIKAARPLENTSPLQEFEYLNEQK